MHDGIPFPPESLRFMGRSDEDFLRVGDEIAGQMFDLGDLQADDSVIDVGSGYGRVAHALLRHRHRGTYLGLDILAPHIAWCQDHLTPFTGGRYRFRHIDVRNDRYNPTGQTEPTEVHFEVEHPANFALVASVFTHMYGDAVRHYLQEIAHATRPGGTVMATFFLINDSQRALEDQGKSPYPLAHRVGTVACCWKQDDPLHVIGFEQEWVELQVESAGFEIQAIHLGSWCGRVDARVYQDTLIMARR